MRKVIDTNILISYPNIILEEHCIIPSTVIVELENIKTSGKKSEEVRYLARKAICMLEDNCDKYEIYVVDNSMYDVITDYFKLPITNDNLIIACAYIINKNEEIIFVSNDLLAKQTAKIFGLNIKSYAQENKEYYKGFKEVVLSDEEMAELYENLNTNTYNCLINEYLIIKDNEQIQKDIMRWNGYKYVSVNNKSIKTMAFGDKIKAKDIYQQIAIDNLLNNSVCAISGHAGSGKSLLSLVVAMHLIETGKYDTLVILTNPTKSKGASDCGYYSGSMIEKLMQNSIGNILVTKFGDRYSVDMMIQQNKIKLVSMADCRGMEIRDNEILWITECQNTSIELLKLCLSRVSQNAKVFIEGDYESQTDSYAFEGDKNGMRRAIEILKGEDLFGFVELQNVWRSKLAMLVDKM